MIKLSDYLNYLNDEVVQARKQADEQAVHMAKLYAEHEYLKFFTVPRFVMPSVKMEIPIKISEIDSKAKYNYKMDEATYLNDVNERIRLVNSEKGLNISPLTQDSLKDEKFQSIVRKLESRDQRFVKERDSSLHKIDFGNTFERLATARSFTTANDSTEKTELAKILKESMRNRYTLVSAKLNNIFIDPNTSKEMDKGKILLKLNVEMVEEGIKINHVTDANGKKVEEVIID